MPVFDEVVISLQGMNRIRGFDSVSGKVFSQPSEPCCNLVTNSFDYYFSGILTADAGCVLEVLDNWLSEKGYMMPLDLGAKGR